MAADNRCTESQSQRPAMQLLYKHKSDAARLTGVIVSSRLIYQLKHLSFGHHAIVCLGRRSQNITRHLESSAVRRGGIFALVYSHVFYVAYYVVIEAVSTVCITYQIRLNTIVLIFIIHVYSCHSMYTKRRTRPKTTVAIHLMLSLIM